MEENKKQRVMKSLQNSFCNIKIVKENAHVVAKKKPVMIVKPILADQSSPVCTEKACLPMMTVGATMVKPNTVAAHSELTTTVSAPTWQSSTAGGSGCHYPILPRDYRGKLGR